MLFLNVTDFVVKNPSLLPNAVPLIVSSTTISGPLTYASRDPSWDRTKSSMGAILFLPKVHVFPENVYTLKSVLSYTTRT